MDDGPAFAPLPFRPVPLTANILRIAPAGHHFKWEDAMRTRLSLTLPVATAFACSLHPAPAQAQRVFVSATGSDGNPCTFASPCRSFQHAHDTTGAGGEIDVLDPAGYGAVTINKAISIQGHGFSGITVGSGGTGITINAGSSDAITLNGLIIDGAHAGADGIVFNNGGILTVTDCVVQNFVTGGGFDGNGIMIQPSSGTVNFAITNTIVANNGATGIGYQPPSGTPSANGVIDHVVATNNVNGTGITVNAINASSGSTVVAVSNSVASNNAQGIFAQNGGSGRTTVSIDNVSVSGNGDGISAFSSARVLLGRSAIIGNLTGIRNFSSPNTFFTYKDNRLNENGTDICSGIGCSPLNTTLAPQ
jgi:hypothetical protein